METKTIILTGTALMASIIYLNKSIYTGEIKTLVCLDCKGNYIKEKYCTKYTKLCNSCTRGQTEYLVKRPIYICIGNYIIKLIFHI